jgi:hypothetical protein
MKESPKPQDQPPLKGKTKSEASLGSLILLTRLQVLFKSL